MKILHLINSFLFFSYLFIVFVTLFFIILFSNYDFIFLSIYAHIVLGGSQILIAFSLLFFSLKKPFKNDILCYLIYVVIDIILINLSLKIELPLSNIINLLLIVILPIVLAIKLTLITYNLNKSSTL